MDELINEDGVAFGDWIPRKEVMKFFGYGETAMAEIEKKLTTSKIGRRVFISRSSLLALLEENIKKNG
jgi:hypothetical protein